VKSLEASREKGAKILEKRGRTASRQAEKRGRTSRENEMKILIQDKHRKVRRRTSVKMVASF
jgi:hypothetical protein